MEEIFNLIDTMTSEQELFCLQTHMETGDEIRAVFDLGKLELKEYLKSLKDFDFTECKIRDKGAVEDVKQ
jgi:hypothetical protein